MLSSTVFGATGRITCGTGDHQIQTYARGRASLMWAVAVLSGSFVLGIPDDAGAQCVAAGATLTCSGTLGPASFPINNVNVSPFSSVILAPGFTGTDTSSGTSVNLRKQGAGAAEDLNVTVQSGATLENADSDSIHLRNDRNGSNTVVIDGVISNSVGRGIRLQSNATSAADTDRVVVGADGRIDTFATGIWVRHNTGPGLNLGSIVVDIYGEVIVDTIRGIHISANDSGNTNPIDVFVRQGALVQSGEQAIYVGNTGSGPSTILIDGVVRGGTSVADLATFGPSGAIILDVEGGDATVRIGATGHVSSVNNRAITAISVTNTVVASDITIENAGTIEGYIELREGGADQFSNTGIWTTAGLTSDFGGGADELTNSGLINGANGTGTQLTQVLNVDSFVNSGGIIDLSDGVAGDQFRIGGDLVTAGGVIRLDTVLGADGSATDRLLVDGDVSNLSPTGLLITPVGGSGALTTTGIMVVDVQGTSSADAFVLANAAALEIGAYAYDLNFGTCDGTANSDWYLCSSGQVSSAGAIYESAPSVLIGAFANLPTLEQRTGQREWLMRGNENRLEGLWMRASGEKERVDPSLSTADASWRGETWALQAGVDVRAADFETGYWVVGLNSQYQSVHADVTNAIGRGRISGTGGGLGLSATWHGIDGLYVDLQGQANWIHADFSTSNQGSLVRNETATAHALSAEIGHLYALNGNMALVPQAQVQWGQLNSERFTDSQGNVVDLGTNSQTIGRLGLAYEYYPDGVASAEKSPDARKVYAIFNILHDFSDASQVEVAGAELASRDQRVWGEIGLGGSMAIAPNTVVYGEASHRTSLSGDASDNTASYLTGGFRMHW